MKLVIDTNILWVSVSRRSKTNWLFQDLIKGKYTLCVTSDILDEYAEIIEQKMGHKTSEVVLKLLDELENVEFVTKYFQWQFITADYDDNKFVDCAIACNAHYLATNDKHFNVLKKVEFPKVNVINLKELTSILKSK